MKLQNLFMFPFCDSEILQTLIIMNQPHKLPGLDSHGTMTGFLFALDSYIISRLCQSSYITHTHTHLHL